MSAPPVLISTELAETFEGGVSILVGTRDSARVPEGALGVGAIVHPDRRRITILLPTEPNARAIANVRETGIIAVAFSNSIDHQTTQVKGRVLEVRAGTEEEHEVCIRYRVALAERLAIVGQLRSVVRGVVVWPATAVTFEVEDLFQQTPGPGAGERLSPPARP